MSDEKRTFPAAWTEQIDDYLDRVEASLKSAGANRASRRSVTEMVEDQIAEMCRTKLNDDSANEEFQSVFSQLDSAESFAREFRTSTSEVDAVFQKPKPKNSVLAIVAAVLTGLAGCLVFISILAALDGDFPATAALSATSLSSSLIAAALGWLALKRIESSRGMLKGRRIARFGIFGPLMLIANALLIFVSGVFPPLPIIVGVGLILGFFNRYVYRLICTNVERGLEPQVKTKNGDFGMPSASVAV